MAAREIRQFMSYTHNNGRRGKLLLDWREGMWYNHKLRGNVREFLCAKREESIC